MNQKTKIPMSDGASGLRNTILALAAVGIVSILIFISAQISRSSPDGDATIALLTALDLVKMAIGVIVVGIVAHVAIKLFFPKTIGNFVADDFNSAWKNEMSGTEKVRWTIVVFLVLFFGGSLCAGTIPVVKGLPVDVSTHSRTKIVEWETGGMAYYNSRLSRATWPKGASGITVGIGYDLGYNTRDQIRKDWSGTLPAATVSAMESFAGYKGQSASLRASAARQLIVVPWDKAIEVFDRSTMPRFTAMTTGAFGFGKGRLGPHKAGALVSIVFNRGASMSGPSRLEMRQIATDIATRNDNLVPSRILSMKRLWRGKNLDGLLKRRDGEATLWRL